MSHSPSKDPDALGQPADDGHGPAALLLVESLIHGLIEKSVLNVSEAVEIVEVALQVKRELTEDAGNSSASSQNSITALEAISQSLQHDLPDGHVE